MIIQNHADHQMGRVIDVRLLEQHNKFPAAMPFFHVRQRVPVVSIQ